MGNYTLLQQLVSSALLMHSTKESVAPPSESAESEHQADDVPVSAPTARITRADLNTILNHYQRPFGLRMGAANIYTPMPLLPASRLAGGEGIIWRIELHGLGLEIPPAGYDIMGDVALGRVAEEVDIDLEHFGAIQQGVSRRHALLRPSRNCLYLLDLSSTNGTFYNGMRLSPGTVHAINDGDTITLGRFSFQIRLIDWPALHLPH